jgi:hypothetical protein
VIVEAAKLDITQYTVQYELVRSQVIGSAGDVTTGETATVQRGGVGLALLLNEGMPGWVRSVETVLRTTPARHAADVPCPALQQDSPQSSVTPVWLSSVRHEAAALLASLVLSTRPAVRQFSGEGYRSW